MRIVGAGAFGSAQGSVSVRAGRRLYADPVKPVQIAFVALLALSALITSGLGVPTLLDPEGMMVTFGVAVQQSPGLDLLTAVLGGVLISLALFVFLAAWWSYQGRPAGRTLGQLAAVTLLLVAVCAWAIGGSLQVLLLDGVRGVVLLVLGSLWKPAAESSAT